MADQANDLSDIAVGAPVTPSQPAPKPRDPNDLTDLGIQPESSSWRDKPIDLKSLDLSDISAGGRPEPEAKAYSVQNGQIQFSHERPATGLEQATQDGVVDPDYAAQHLDDFRRLQVRYQDFQEAAGSAQVAKAILHGAGRGAAFMAGAIPGGKAGAAIGAVVPGAEEITVPVGAGIGSLTTGSLAAFAYGKAVDKLADYNETVRSLQASAELHPVANAAGELAAFASTAPSSISKLYRLSQLPGGGAAVAAQVAKGAAAGAAFEGVLRPGFDVARHLIADQMGIDHEKTQAPSFGSIAQNVALGILTAGHSVEFRNYTADEMTNLMLRAKAREAAGIPMGADDPAAVIRGFQKIGAQPEADLQKNGLLRPLDAGETAAYADLVDQMNELRRSGKLTDQEVESLGAGTQATIRSFGKTTQLTRTGFNLRPRVNQQTEPTTTEEPNGNRISSTVAQTGEEQTASVQPTGSGPAATVPPVTPPSEAPAPRTPIITPPPSNPAPAAAVQPSAQRAPVPDPNWQVTVQNDNGVPGSGYVQIDDVSGGQNNWSKSPKTLGEEGYTVPDFSSLPQGKYTFDEAITKLNQQSAAPAPVQATPKTEEPTPAQKEAGNYKKDHISIAGLDISIENKKGTVRSGTDKGGNAWSVTMPADYGYIKGTKGNDKDHLDVYVGTNPDPKYVWVVDQIDPQTKKFDEHKTFVGFNNYNEVFDAYTAAFSDGSGPERMGSATTMPIENFKKWIKTGDMTKPVGYEAPKPETKTKGKRAPAAQRPEATPKAEKQWKFLGRNARGNNVYEDENGVRSYTEKGIRSTEAVSIIPTREGVKIGVKTEHDADYTPVHNPDWQAAADRLGIPYAQYVEMAGQNSKQQMEKWGVTVAQLMEKAAIEGTSAGKDKVENPEPAPTVATDVDTRTESTGGNLGTRGGQSQAANGPGGEQPTSGNAPQPNQTVQPGVQPANAEHADDGGAGNSRVADADANGVPASGQPEPPLIPSADTGLSANPSVSGGPTEADPAPAVEVGGTVQPQQRNIRLTENPAPTGAVARIKANIEAITVVRKLDTEQRPPTEDERKVIAQWSGWGSFKELFNEGTAARRDYDPGWVKRYGGYYDRLQKLLSADEFQAAAESTVNAHYTSKEVVDGMWNLVKRLGFKGGKALEPSTGSGVFVGYIPDDLESKTRWTGVEMEPITARIFSLLYPEANTMAKPFEKAKLPNAYYDLVITNVPFHETGPGAEYPSLNLHNYFIARGLDKVKPGGLVVVITTNATMDNDGQGRREQRGLLADKGELVGAIRLPNNAFKESAGTEVVTDILVLRKPDGKPNPDAQAWRNTTMVEIGDGTGRINEYFAQHPDMVLGKNSLTGTMYRKDSYTVEGTAGSLAEKLAKAIEKFPQNITQQAPEETTIEPSATQLEEGSLSLDASGRVLEARNFLLQKPTWSGATQEKRAKLYLHLRDVLKQQYAMEDDPNATEAEIEANRARLNRAYQALMKDTKKPLNESKRSLDYLSTDPDYYTVLGLEVYRERPDPKMEGGTITVIEPADVLSRRVKTPDVAPTTAGNAVEALGISLAYKGGFDLQYVQQLTGMSAEAIEAELLSSNQAFKDPDSGKVEINGVYLSGDVREKLAKAIFAAKESDEFARNVEALRKVIPETVPFARIKLNLDARWAPVQVFNAFARDVLGFKGDEIKFIPGIEEFSVQKKAPHQLSDIARTQYTTNDLTATELLAHAMNFQTAKVMRYDSDGKAFEDKDASAVANQIIDRMENEFQQWVRTTQTRVPFQYFDADKGDYVQDQLVVWDVLEREFNRTKNSFIEPSVDGTLLKLPGLSNLVLRKPHLMTGVMRAILQGSAVYAHGVGSGKTFLSIVAMNELRRIGLAKKGVIVIKKPTVDQFRASIERAYPGSRVLLPTEKDFEAANRKKLTARIASGKWDFIVLTHEQFKAVRTSEESVNSFFMDQITQLRNILYGLGGKASDENAKSTRGMDPAVRNVVKKIKSLKKRLEKHTTSVSKRQDVGLEWEKLGVDGIWIDESHNYKKMPIPTQMDNVKGIPVDFSQRAVDLLIKIRDVQRRTNGRNVFFASGTPVSNTLAELWVMLHATNPKLLKQFGVETFDSFATAFADVVSSFELGWDDKFKDVTRMARFKNPGGLTMLTRLGVDVRIGNKELGLDVPELAGGKPVVRIIKSTPAFERWVTFLKQVVSKWETLDPKGRFENSWVPITTMRAGSAAALDPRSAFEDGQDHPASKVNTAVNDIFAEWEKGKERRTTMMVFADMYRTLNTSKLRGFVGGQSTGDVTEVEVPDEDTSDDSGDTGAKDANAYESQAVGKFNLYEDVKAKLIARGVPENEIAIITDFDTDVKRAALFNKVRSGAVRVLMGSTEKIGEGVDVPQRMSAQFHLDPPMQMTPAKMEQRFGRIIRQGNLHSPKNWNIPVNIYLYAQERSMDAAIYQMLENKGIMVLQFLKGQYLGDEFDDPAGEFTMQMAEMKAAATGDTRVLELAKLQKEVRELRVKQGAFHRRISELRRDVDQSEYKARSQAEEAQKYTNLAQAMEKETADDKTTVLSHKGKRYVGIEAIDQFLERARPAFEDSLKEEGKSSQMHMKLGTDVNVEIRGRTSRSFSTQQLVTSYEATFYIGPELNWGVPRWDSNLSSIESLMTAAKGVAGSAEKRAVKAMASSKEGARLAAVYSKTFKETTFPEEDVLKEKSARLYSLESELRKEGEKKPTEPAPDQEAQEIEINDAPPIEDRIKAQMTALAPQLEKANEELVRAKGRLAMADPSRTDVGELQEGIQEAQLAFDKLSNRIHDLERRLAVVVKAKNPNKPIDMPAPPEQPELSIERTPTSIGEERVVRGLQELSDLLTDSRSGLSPEAARVALDLLNTPVMQNLDWSNLTVSLRNRIGAGYSGAADVTQNLIELTKQARSSTLPHEVFHFLFHMLSPEDKLHVAQARTEAISQAIEAYGGLDNMPDDMKALFQSLRTGMSSDAFVQQRNRLLVESTEKAEWWESLYHLINPSEFLAGMAGNRFAKDSFEARNYSWWDNFIAKLKAWIRGIMDSVKRIVGMRPDIEQIYRELLRGQRVTTPDSGVDYELGKQGQFEGESPANAGVDPADLEIEAIKAENIENAPGWIKTEVLGRKDYVRGRDVLTNAERAAGADYAKKVFDRTGLQVRQQQNGLWELADKDMESEIEGRKLLEILGKEIALQNQPGAVTGYLGNLLNSVVVNMTTDNVDAFSPELRRELYSVAQGERSQRGLLLASLAGFGKTVQYVGRNVDTVLAKVYADRFGGDEIRKILSRVLIDFRGSFTDAEIQEALNQHPDYLTTMNTILALNRRDEGGRVYRRAQSMLKPKAAKKLSKLEANARVGEAVNEILAQLHKQGISPVAQPNKTLSPLHKLLMLVKPENAEKIDKAIAGAIGDAEHNAGIKFALKNAQDAEERQDLLERFSAGEEPDEQDVEGGLQMAEFAHWKALRDNLLGYSPVTLKVVRNLVQADFRGVNYKRKPAVRAKDTRIDLNVLAKQPDDEVRRVLNAYAQNLESTMKLEGATPETQLRVLDDIQREVTAQLERVRRQMRDKQLAEPVKKGQEPTPEQRMAELINTGIFKDDRLDVRAMVDRLAHRTALQNLVPNATTLAKQVFSTPYYRQDQIPENFAQWQIDNLQVTPEQADQAKKVFKAAFDVKMAKARASAFTKAMDSLTPQERAPLKKGKGLWKKIEEAVNSGVFDTGIVLQTVAASHGWTIPSAEEVARVKAWAGEIQRLNELSATERQAVGDNPAAIEQATRDKQAATLEKRIALKKKIEGAWSKMTHPMNLGTAEGRTNIAQAVNEFTSANLLFKIGFAPRLAIDILTQGFLHTPTRAVSAAIGRYQTDKSAGRTVSLWKEITSALRDAYRVRLASTAANLANARQAMAGKGDARNIDRLVSRIAVFERMERQVEDLTAKGDHVRAGILRLVQMVSFSYRVAQTLDNFQGLPAEYQEMRQQVETALRENGQSKAEAAMNADNVIGDMKAEWQLAIGRVQEIFQANGIEATPAEVRAAAWHVVKSRQYARMRALGLPADDFEEINRILRSTVAWAEREDGGLGGLVGVTMRKSTEVLAGLGLPMPLARFSNAIATGINRKLMYTPLGFFPGAFKDSPWMRTEEDRRQRKVEASVGTSFGLLAIALVLGGVVKVWLKPPRDKEERDLWEKEGHRANTVEFYLPDGSYMPFSLLIGPMAILSPYFAAAGAVKEAHDRREKQQEKLNAEAARTGTVAGDVRRLDLADYLSVAGDTAYQSLLGGRTAVGLISSFTDENRLPNASKLISSVLSPLIPGLPALQEMSRLAGVQLDPRLASTLDYMVPLPSSAAAKTNLLGDPSGTESGLQRITQILTGGSYPLPIDPTAAHSQLGYQALFDSGYRPPSISTDKSYAINGEYRPLNKQENARYAELRGQYLKEELMTVADTSDRNEVKAAFQRANQRALDAVGVDRGETAQATSRTGSSGSGSSSAPASRPPSSVGSTLPGRRVGAGRVIRRGGVRRAGPRSVSATRRAGASLRPGRGISSRRSTSRRVPAARVSARGRRRSG
jgi:N12 class adenine-specific DNA methylase